MIKGEITFAKKTIDWVHEVKAKNNTKEKVKQLLDGVPHETAKMLENLAVPVVGTAALNSMPLTKREKMLAGFGLMTATSRLLAFDQDTPLFWEAKGGNVSNALDVSSNTTATVDEDTRPPKSARHVSAFERQVLNWAARGE
mmetsp:Transcript_10903/g.16355  ORF Transcript_10903/g.16355 Transcript_10903/m.16355 type:complete len:142 (-) Transcript_10903:91-516(-)